MTCLYNETREGDYGGDMKKIILLLFMLLPIISLYADEYAFFRQMSPEEK